MKPPKILNTQTISHHFLSLRKELMETANGQLHEYTSVVLPTDATVILAQDASDRFLLNREYRHPCKQELLGLPGGRLDPDEVPMDGAKREFLEETGYRAQHMYLLGACYPFPGICNQKVYLFAAKGLQKIEKPHLDPLEMIETLFLSEEELIQKLEQGHIQLDGMVSIALWYFKRKKEQFLS